MRVIVAQIGARHHYAIPRMLARAGQLEAFYTDSCVHRGLGSFLDATIPRSLRTGRLEKLLERRVDGVPEKRIYSTDTLLLDELVRPKRTGLSSEIERAGAIFSRAMMKWGTRNATHIYSMFGEGIEFLRAAKCEGLRICLDVFITPVAHRIIAAERSRFPEWEGPSDSVDASLEARVVEILKLADILLCPGDNVVQGVNLIADQPLSTIRVVPYGSGLRLDNRLNTPTNGRVLFAGTAELRKGIHYFAAAAERLKTFGWDFRVAGGFTDRVRRMAPRLRFLGRLSRSAMIEELLRADILVLPTLAEGSASVIIEALMMGLPVITTKSAGSPVNDMDNGLLVSERDPESLADAIQRSIQDRTLRSALAVGARSSADELSEEAWAARLIRALEG